MHMVFFIRLNFKMFKKTWRENDDDKEKHKKKSTLKQFSRQELNDVEIFLK